MSDEARTGSLSPARARRASASAPAASACGLPTEIDAAAVLDQEVLVLDDLYTTGGSMHRLLVARACLAARGVSLWQVSATVERVGSAQAALAAE